jgi:hypothetical protein
MRVCRHFLVAVLVANLSVPYAFARARHAVDPSVVAGMVREHARELEADRAVIRDILARPEVKTVASTAGIDVERLRAAVDTLSAADVARVAQAARAVEAPADSSLVGGASTVTISTTTIIIGLLVLILIIVAVR